VYARNVKPALFILFLLNFASLAAPFGVPGDDPSPPRQYAPDRNYQVRHLALDVTPDFRRRTVSGTATITFAPIAKPLTEMRLNAVDLQIESIDSPEAIQAYTTTTDELVITFASAIPADKETRVAIKYSAEPRQGMYFRTPELGYKAEDEHLFTQGESTEARHWYPCFDAPNEKFTSEVTCHAPADMLVLSNGRQTSSEKDANGLVAVHWAQEKPLANYLLTLVAGHFNKWEDHLGDVPLPVYTAPSDPGDVALTFRDTRDIMEFFNGEIGVMYPWVKYGQVCVQDFVAGGMENISQTTLTDRTLHRAETENLRDSDSLIAHEMAHQWFGDLVTCKDWSQIWLNEGFATFYEQLYEEHRHGADEALYGAYGSARGILEHATDNRPIVNRKFANPDEMFDYLAYPKGAFVLRMLRAELGAPLYRQCIKTYLERHQFGNATTEDLASVVEELSGRSFDKFFDQWVYHGHFPELDVNYSWDEQTKLAHISVRQTQKASDEVLLFEFPFTVAFHGKSGAAEKTVRVKDRQADYYFALEGAPESVTIDPHMALLAKIDFSDLTPSMAFAALKDSSDVVGRLRAVNRLRDARDRMSVEKLKNAVQRDPFYGVRIEAASALAAIHSDESLAALMDSREQTDARVRQAVMQRIGGFYNPRAFEAEKKALEGEKNPDIAAAEIRALGNSDLTTVRDTLLTNLQSETYHNTLASAAIGAMRSQHDEFYLTPLIENLRHRAADFNGREFAAGLDAVAVLAHDKEDKDAAREFLAGFVNDHRQTVQSAALRALGTLEDPRALPILQTFADASKESAAHRAAEQAMESIRTPRKPADNLKDLRDTVAELQKANRKLQAEVDTLKKEFEAEKSAPASKKKKR